ncbi:Scramblase-domain-containing protein [Serendipita vermifera]|nr:Scramblase-domain-containing protein [Serendipita vermifera]
MQAIRYGLKQPLNISRGISFHAVRNYSTPPRGRIFRSLKTPTPRKRSQTRAEEPPITPPALSNENTWNGVFPDADAKMEVTSEYSQEGLRKILAHDTLIVTRQIEMLNIFLGYEQANRYAILNPQGEHVGFIAEQERSFLWTVGRQLMRTNRPVRALVMDTQGFPLLWVRRPFQFINSRMYAQRRPFDTSDQTLETFGEIQQVWHPWRRKYDLFMRKEGNEHSAKEAETQDHHFTQFARIDEGLFSWNFTLRDRRGQEIASVSRGFRGWGRELFTDTGQYTIRFTPTPLDLDSPNPILPPGSRQLTVDERALVLALSIDVDVDYFSRHSEGHTGMAPWLLLFGGGGDE